MFLYIDFQICLFVCTFNLTQAWTFLWSNCLMLRVSWSLCFFIMSYSLVRRSFTNFMSMLFFSETNFLSKYVLNVIAIFSGSYNMPSSVLRDQSLDFLGFVISLATFQTSLKLSLTHGTRHVKFLHTNKSHSMAVAQSWNLSWTGLVFQGMLVIECPSETSKLAWRMMRKKMREKSWLFVEANVR